MAISVFAPGTLLPVARANIVWSTGFSDEDAIGTNAGNSSIATSYGGTATLSTTVFSDNTGGTFDLDPYVNSDYVTYEAGQLGAVRDHVQFSMDNDNDDPDDFVEFAINFDSAVQNLQFSLLDVDSGSWDDGVEIFYNGSNNVRDNATINGSGSGDIVVVDGVTNGIDNESYMHGWEGYGSNAQSSQTLGNIAFNFSDLQITSIRIRYFSTDDANSNPGGQIMGLTNLTFVEAVPEPSSIACMGIFGSLVMLVQFGRRSRRRRRDLPGSVESSPGDLAEDGEPLRRGLRVGGLRDIHSIEQDTDCWHQAA